MRDKDKIHELLTYYQDHFYAEKVRLQNEEYTYYNDTFPVPWIKKPLVVSRTGAGAELIDDPVEQISAANLIVSRPPLKDTQTAKESAIKVSELLNGWIKRIMKINPNPKKEQIKNMFFGESWIHPVHNPQWVKAPFDRSGLPVFFLIPDPRIIFASPNEDENGIPEHVLVYYARMPWMVKTKYPAWTSPKLTDTERGGGTVAWLEYWDADDRHFEADEETVLSSPNPYKLVPFVHKLSGFGKSSNEGKPEDLVVGRIRRYKDLLQRDAASTSDIDSIIHMFANPPLDAQGDDMHPVPKDFDKTYIFGAGNLNVIPPGVVVKRGVDFLPSPEVLQWNYSIKADLGRKTPSVLGGVPQGETGRLQDIAYTTAMRKWEGIVSSCADQWATALGMALRMCDEMPELMPDEISHDDLKKNYVVEVELRADDPLETARKSADGDRKQIQGIIDWETNLVEYQGFTVEEAQEIIDNTVIDKIILNDPVTLRMLALQNAKERGMEQEYLAIEAQLGGAGKMPTPPQIGSEGGQPREGNIKTPLGAEQIDLSRERRPTRLSPL